MARRKSKQQQKSHSRYSQTDDKTSATSKSDNVSEKGTTNDQSPEETATNSSKGNDPEWYARDPYLLRDAASYPFSYAYGVNYNLTKNTRFARSQTSDSAAVAQLPIQISGIMALRMKPTMGFSDSATSPLNVAAASIYAYVRHLNSGRKNYDPVDLVLYMTAIAQLYSFTVWCERLYSFGLTYSEMNRFIPEQLLVENGVNPSNFRQNLANFRMWLNTFINKISVWAVPNNITYFNKVVFMYRDLYIENNDGNIKDQLYMYVPDGFYKYALDADSAGMLDYAHWPFSSANSTLANVQDIINFGEDLLTAIFQDEDASLMSGDMFKVYGEGSIIRLPSMDDFLVLPLVYDPMILWQMRNTTPVPLIRKGNSEVSGTTSNNRTNITDSTWSLGANRQQLAYPGCVFQNDDGMLISAERLVKADSDSASTTYDYAGSFEFRLAFDSVLVTEVAHPDPGIVMESSRNMVTGHVKPLGTPSQMSDKGWITCGSFVCIQVYACSTSSTSATGFDHQPVNTLVTGISSAIPATLLQFKYRPLIVRVTLTQTTNMVSGGGYTDDLNNFTVLTNNSITKLHDVALLNLFFVPGIAKIS